MRTTYQLCETLRHDINRWFNNYQTSEQTNANFNEWIKRHCYSEKGKLLVRKKDIDILNYVFWAIKNQNMDQKTIFGYWYKDEFYTTRKDTQHKTTKILHDLKLPQEMWNSLKIEMVYKDNLKPYF